MPTGTVYYVPFYADQAPNEYAEPPPGFEPHHTTPDEWRDWDEADARAFAALGPARPLATLQGHTAADVARSLLNLRPERRRARRQHTWGNTMNDRAGLDPRRPSLGDIEEVPRQLADLAVASYLDTGRRRARRDVPAAGRRRRRVARRAGRAERLLATLQGHAGLGARGRVLHDTRRAPCAS